MASRGLNRVMIIGNLGKDPEMRYTAGGKAVTSFNVGVGRISHTTDGAVQEETEWFRVVAWEKLGETCNSYLRKGSKVYVEGRQQTRTWQDTNGVDKKTVELIASDMQMLDSRPTSGASGGASGATVPQRTWEQNAVAAGEIEDDDPPF